MSPRKDCRYRVGRQSVGRSYQRNSGPDQRPTGFFGNASKAALRETPWGPAAQAEIGAGNSREAWGAGWWIPRADSVLYFPAPHNWGRLHWVVLKFYDGDPVMPVNYLASGLISGARALFLWASGSYDALVSYWLSDPGKRSAEFKMNTNSDMTLSAASAGFNKPNPAKPAPTLSTANVSAASHRNAHFRLPRGRRVVLSVADHCDD